MPRWKCPKCDAGCNAPSRPRRDDARRYCLACTAKTGRLVERVCLIHEKRAEVKKASREARALRAEATRAAQELNHEALLLDRAALGLPAPWPARVQMLRDCFKEWSKLKAWETDLSGVELVIRRRSRAPLDWTSGHCCSDRRIVITVGVDDAKAKKTLLHELAHAAAAVKRRAWLKEHRDSMVPGRSNDPYYYHGIGFRGLFLSAAREVTGLPVIVKGATIHDVGRAVAEAMRESAKERNWQ